MCTIVEDLIVNEKYLISDHIERYTETGLSFEFLAEMTKAVEALQAAGYEPYDQLYGYVMYENELYRQDHCCNNQRKDRQCFV